MKSNIPIFLCLLSLFSCTPDQEQLADLLSTENLATQTFTVQLGTDTTLQTKGGMKIFISANSFLINGNEGPIQLAVQEALEKKDMIKAGLFTIDSAGNILESGGMFSIDAQPDLPINAEAPIKVQVPAPYLNTKMTLFTPANPDDLSAGWVEKSALSITPLMDKIEEGASIFNDWCAMCHSMDLRKPLTGPPLGNVHLFRSPAWLEAFTWNSHRMIEGGDTIARCLWQQWKPTVMVGNADLAPEDIAAIYTYIAQESQVQQIGYDEIEYIVDCEFEESPQLGLQYILDTASNLSFDVEKDSLYYQLDLSSFNWYNIDYFLWQDTIRTETVSPFQIKLKQTKGNHVTSLFLYFKNRNILIPFYYSNSVKGYVLAEAKDKVELPLGEEVQIVCIQKGKQYWMAQKSVKIDYENQHTLAPEPTDKKQILDFLDAIQ